MSTPSNFEEELKRDQNRVQLRSETARLGTWELRVSDRTLNCSPHFNLLHGFAPTHEIRSLDAFVAAVHPDDREEFSTSLNRCLRDGRAYGMQYRVIGPDGRVHWREAKATVEVDEAAKPAKVLGIAIDIDKFKAVEQSLRDSEERYRKLVELSPDAILVHRGGCISLINQAGLDLFAAQSAEQMIGRPALALLHPDSHPMASERIRTMQRSDVQLPVVEEKIVRNDGRVIDVEVAASSFTDAGGRAVQVVLRDISERKRVCAEHARLSRAVEQAGESIVITDANGIILYVNPACERISGYRRAELMGRNASVLSGGADSAELPDASARMQGGEPWSGTAVSKRKDGRPYEEEVTISPVRDAAGRLINYVAVKRDVSKERWLQNQLHQAQKMEAIGRLAGGVAHDFNNLLMVITSHSEMLQEQLAPLDRLRRNTEQILTAAERGARLTQQLLALGRKQILSAEVLNLNTVINEAADMLKRLVGENIELSFTAAADLGGVKGDPGQMVQILVDLCVNARDAMPEGGKLSIETANAELDASYAARHPSVAPGQYVMLAATDNGVGMRAEVKARIFEPFFSTKPIDKGTGLGLATAYGIVKQSGGYIWVDSEPGQGACFKCYFPRVNAQKLPIANPPLPDWQGGSETILLAEDETALRESLAAFLIRCGYEVLEAQNGQHALEVASQHSGEIDLLLTDVVMPKLSGRELHQRLSTQRPGLKTLFMSGYTDDSIVRHGVLEVGFAFLQKPFTLKALARKVRDALSPPLS